MAKTTIASKSPFYAETRKFNNAMQRIAGETGSR